MSTSKRVKVEKIAWFTGIGLFSQAIEEREKKRIISRIEDSMSKARFLFESSSR